jgi:hypothetical protein
MASFPAVLFSITLINIKEDWNKFKSTTKKRDIPMNQSVILKVGGFIHKVSDSFNWFSLLFFLLLFLLPLY